MRSVPGSGTLVNERPGGRRGRPAAEEPADTVPALDRPIAVAIDIADREGRTALTMRRLAGELGVGAMSLWSCAPACSGGPTGGTRG
ncbi:hypothetical protein [Embleya hyalina]|uniref:GntR family transcriptional regulator n=1 Tax=Embleya hyalina TaxID=516124 RepID=A0A401YLR8_9ACTN|nr:hypothetical protein [Embleya hyalina]GCD95554.1 GntR family transcriptional regulator [Embleya hyalina]